MSSTYDFGEAFFEVVLVGSDGSELPLRAGPVDGDAATALNYETHGPTLATNLAIATSLTVEQSFGTYFSLSLDLGPTYEDALTLFDSDAVVQGETRVRVRFGYPGNGSFVSPWYTGLVIDPDFAIGEEFRITLKASATMGWSAARDERSLTPINGKTRKELVESFAIGEGDPKRKVRVDWSLVKAGGAEANLLEAKIDYTPKKNDWESIKDVLDQALCTFIVSDDTDAGKDASVLKVFDLNTRFGGPPRRRFRLFSPRVDDKDSQKTSAGGVFYGALQGGIFPIFGLNTQSKQVFLRGVNRGYSMQAFDEKAKTIENNLQQVEDSSTAPDVGPKASKGKKLAKGPATSARNPKPKAGKGGAVTQVDRSFTTEVDQAKADLYRASIDAGIQFSVETVGIPDMAPGEIVYLEGLGQRFSGTYAVHKVSHVISVDGGYGTRFECISTGGYNSGKERAGKVQVNTQPAKDSGKVVTAKKQ